MKIEGLTFLYASKRWRPGRKRADFEYVILKIIGGGRRVFLVHGGCL